MMNTVFFDYSRRKTKAKWKMFLHYGYFFIKEEPTNFRKQDVGINI
jgi:hypothetical protein